MEENKDTAPALPPVPPDVLQTIRTLLSKGSSLHSAYYCVRGDLPRGYSRRVFEREAATPGTPLYRAVRDGAGSFGARFCEQMWTQLEEGVASASRSLNDFRRQQAIAEAIAKEFPEYDSRPAAPDRPSSL